LNKGRKSASVHKGLGGMTMWRRIVALSLDSRSGWMGRAPLAPHSLHVWHRWVSFSGRQRAISGGSVINIPQVFLLPLGLPACVQAANHRPLPVPGAVLLCHHTPQFVDTLFRVQAN
jgi:hypothetical protein